MMTQTEQVAFASEQQLREELAWLSTVFASSPVAMIVTDAAGRPLRWNQLAAELGRVADYVFDDDYFEAPEHRKRMERLLAQLPLSEDGALVALMRGEEERYYRLRTASLADYQPRLRGRLIRLIDETEIQRHTQVLARQRERLELALDAARQASWELASPDGEIVVSDSFWRLLDLPPLRLQSTEGDAVIERLRLVREKLLSALAEDERVVIEQGFPDEHGREHLFELHARVVRRDEDGRTLEIIGTARDITEQRRQEVEQRLMLDRLAESNAELKRAQGMLLQSEKLAAIGQLAAGVAHEINNPLGYVRQNLVSLDGYVDELLEIVAACHKAMREPAEENVRAAEEAAKELDYLVEDSRALMKECGEGLERIARIVADLKDFSRRDDEARSRVDLNDRLEKVLNLAHNEIKYKATVERDLMPLPKVLCRPHQIDQVMLNIIVNAAQAIEKQGVIRVATRDEGDAVSIIISDNGCGMTEEVRRQIFDPFFTTKPPGKGTGLGLAVVWGIVERHGGTIDVDSEPGVGTTFIIRLPVGSEEEDEQ